MVLQLHENKIFNPILFLKHQSLLLFHPRCQLLLKITDYVVALIDIISILIFHNSLIESAPYYLTFFIMFYLNTFDVLNHHLYLSDVINLDKYFFQLTKITTLRNNQNILTLFIHELIFLYISILLLNFYVLSTIFFFYHFNSLSNLSQP